jgi:hypothetical protein
MDCIPRSPTVSLYKREPGIPPIRIGTYKKKPPRLLRTIILPDESQAAWMNPDVTYQAFFLPNSTRAARPEEQDFG